MNSASAFAEATADRSFRLRYRVFKPAPSPEASPKTKNPRCTPLHFFCQCSKLVEPEVVATSPNRIKSPVPVYCGIDSLKMVLAAGACARPHCTCTVDVFNVVPLRWATRAKKMEPPAGDAPAEFLQKNPQAAARRQMAAERKLVVRKVGCSLTILSKKYGDVSDYVPES
jgi:hypothetical protein